MSQTRRTLGRSNLSVSPIGLGSSFGLAARDIPYAFDRGINYFYWGSYRRSGFGQGLRELAKTQRNRIVIALQSYTRSAALMKPSVWWGLRRLGQDYADVLLLGWWNQLPPERIMDAALELKRTGLIRTIAISCHHRPSFATFMKDARFDIIMTRYNAGHPGAEQEVFPHLSPERTSRPGVIAYTATRWATLLNSNLIPESEPTPRASDCYRFCLSHPDVDLTLAGPKNRAELDEAIRALSAPALTADERAWMLRVGTAVKARALISQGNALPLAVLDRLSRRHHSKQLGEGR